MRTICILGGGGPFGQHLARYILDHSDDEVLAIGRSRERGPAWTLARNGAQEDYRYWKVNLTRGTDIAVQWLNVVKPEVIVNFAALAAAVWPGAWQYYETNVVGLARLVEGLGPWLKHWVQIGSSEVYGSCDHAVREDERVNPSHPYSVSKAAADLHLLSLARHKGLPLTILRPSNAYGECQQLRRIVPRTVLAALTGGKVPLEGGGVARKSYIHAEDLARAIVLAADAEPKGEVYHIGPTESTPIATLVGLIASMTGIAFEDLAEMAPERLGQDAEYLLDSSKAECELGWYPTINLGMGLHRVIGWAEAHLDELRRESAAPAYQLVV